MNNIFFIPKFHYTDIRYTEDQPYLQVYKLWFFLSAEKLLNRCLHIAAKVPHFSAVIPVEAHVHVCHPFSGTMQIPCHTGRT
jgi:hypothetical protein